MKRYARIGTACLIIVALMVDSVAACWFFARRVRCRPCPPPCYSTPAVYDSCGAGFAGASGPGFSFSEPQPAQPMPGAEGTMRGPSTRIPWALPQPGGATRQPTPADTDPPSSPSDRPETFREPMMEREPTREPEPMPDPPQDMPETTPGARDNPFDRPSTAEPPALEPGDTAPPADETRPTPGAADLDDPFRSTIPPDSTDSTPPAEPALPGDNPFPPLEPAAGGATPPDDPFSPRESAPPAADPFNSPFGAPRNGANPTGATDPAEAEPASGGSTLADPFGPPSNVATPPLGEANPGPMDDGQTTPMSETNDAAPADEQAPAIDDPVAEPAGPRLSASTPEPVDAMRVWTDVTGKHQIRGQIKLILAAEQKVRILKDTGKYTTVPFARLSQTDRTFVARHAIEPSALLAERQ